MQGQQNEWLKFIIRIQEFFTLISDQIYLISCFDMHLLQTKHPQLFYIKKKKYNKRNNMK